MDTSRFRVPFRIAIVGAIVGIVAIMSIATSLVVYTKGKADATANATRLFAENAKRVRERLDNRLGSLTRLAALGSAAPGLDTRVAGYGLDHPCANFLFDVVESEPFIYGAYAGWENGDFLMLIDTALESRIQKANQAPANCRYVVRAISGTGSARAQRWSYLDASRALISRRAETEPAFDPRTRDWYRVASSGGRARLGKAYVFNSLQEPGITASRSFGAATATANATAAATPIAGAFGVDMTLSDLRDFLNESVPSPNGAIFLLEDGARLLAASDSASAWLPAGMPALGDVKAAAIDPPGRAWLRARTDWTWGDDTRLTLIVLAPVTDFTVFFDSVRATLLILALTVLLTVIPVALWLSAQLARPISSMARDAEKVREMDFTGRIAESSWIYEIDRLGSDYALMKDALRTDRALIESQRDSYARFVPERMLALFDKETVTDVGPRNHKNLELTVMFSDIRSYTSISESLSSHAIFELLNDYFEITNPVIDANGGIIDKYIGDAIMSVFPRSPDGALRSAIAINLALGSFNEARKRRGLREILTGTGIHFGDVDLGTVGDGTRMQATVIGDAVNLASRLESATKVFGVRILMSESARARLERPEEFHMRLIDTVRVKGKEQPIDIHEVFDLDEPSVLRRKIASAPAFDEARALYKAGDFSRALERFESCSEACPHDTVVAAYLKRCGTLVRIPAGDEWAGVSTL